MKTIRQVLILGFFVVSGYGQDIRGSAALRGSSALRATAPGTGDFVSSVCGPQTPPGSGNGGSSAAFDSSTADLIVYVMDAAGAATPSDAVGGCGTAGIGGPTCNTYTNPLTAFGTNPEVSLYYAQNPGTVGPSTIITNGSQGGTYPGFCGLAFRNMVTTSVYNNDAVGFPALGVVSGTTSTIQAAALTLPSGHQIMVSVLGIAFCNGCTATIDSGFVTPVCQAQGPNNYGICFSYFLQASGAGQTKQPTWTLAASATGQLKTYSASFKGQ